MHKVSIKKIKLKKNSQPEGWNFFPFRSNDSFFKQQELTRTARLLAFIFFLAVWELAHLYGHMTCWTGRKETTVRLKQISNSVSCDFSLLSRNNLPAFLLFLCLIPLVYFFQNLRFSLPRALRAPLGSVIQAWYRNYRGGARHKWAGSHILVYQLQPMYSQKRWF